MKGYGERSAMGIMPRSSKALIISSYLQFGPEGHNRWKVDLSPLHSFRSWRVFVYLYDFW